jgi:hypothetical protein
MAVLPKAQRGVKVRTEYIAVLGIPLKCTNSDVIFCTEQGKVLAVP